jgi:glycosyltransferase involved in cell wall biosynthesis
MRVLLISQYFPPETGATSNRLASLARGIRAAGHDVVVVAEKPNHPEGVIREGYRDGLFERRTFDGIPVLHTWVYTRPDKNFATRLAFYLSFMVMATFGAARLEGDFDVVLASSPPLFVGVSGWLTARLHGAQFVFDVRDIWPEVAVAMGELENPALIRLAEGLERFLYERADGITAVTEGFCHHIRRKVERTTPMARVMNGTMPDVFNEDDCRDAIRSRLNVENQFVVAYAGNHGLAQGLSHVVEAADRLRDRNDITFIMLGSGPVKEELVSDTRQRELDNILFLDRVPLDEAAAHMAAADALLVPLADHEIYQQFIPSKLFDSMASGRPVLLSVDGEARSILEEAEGGLYYPAEDGEVLAEHIEWLVEHPEEGKEMGEKGRAYAQENCSRAVQAQKMAEFLEQIADK